MQPLDYSSSPRRSFTQRLSAFLSDYSWFIGKNILGWTLILVSFPLGVAIPGPGGIPLFLIGFALVTFPGKRQLTSRVLRGKRMDLQSKVAWYIAAALAMLIPPTALWVMAGQDMKAIGALFPRTRLLVACLIAATVVSWLLVRLFMLALNVLIRGMPRARRFVRPWMRRRGIRLLPPRRRRRTWAPGRTDGPLAVNDEIIEFHERHVESMRLLWGHTKPWLIRVVRIAFVAAILVWMLKPIYLQWSQVRGRILQTNWWQFAAAALMFSVFLFAFRALAWRRILIGFGHRLPVRPAVRIWSMSELARYVPGAIWQVVGRVHLTKPYGVSGSITSASQLLELTIFMLANTLLALLCLLFAGYHRIPPGFRHWVYIAAVFAPLLLLLLHPRIFYGLLNRLMRRLKKPPIEQALRKRQIFWLLLYTMIGLLWQSLAIWVLTRDALDLPLAKWWILAGAYCLAWTMGFSLGAISPAGAGVRELVFYTMLQVLLVSDPKWTAAHHFDEGSAALTAYLAFLAILLRLWTIAGESIMAVAATVLDRNSLPSNPSSSPSALRSSDVASP